MKFFNLIVTAIFSVAFIPQVNAIQLNLMSHFKQSAKTTASCTDSKGMIYVLGSKKYRNTSGLWKDQVYLTKYNPTTEQFEFEKTFQLSQSNGNSFGSTIECNSNTILIGATILEGCPTGLCTLNDIESNIGILEISSTNGAIMHNVSINVSKNIIQPYLTLPQFAHMNDHVKYIFQIGQDYLVAGETGTYYNLQGYIQGQQGWYVARVDFEGNIKWQQYLTGTLINAPFVVNNTLSKAVLDTKKLNLNMVGQVTNINGDAIRLVQIDVASGNINIDRAFTSNNNASINYGIQNVLMNAPYGDLIMAGTALNNSNQLIGIGVMRLDSNLNERWSMIYDSSLNYMSDIPQATDAIIDSNNDVVLTGYKQSTKQCNTFQCTDAFIGKVNFNTGQNIASLMISGNTSGNDFGISIKQDKFGKYILAANMKDNSSFYNDMSVLRISSDLGTVLNKQTFNGIGNRNDYIANAFYNPNTNNYNVVGMAAQYSMSTSDLNILQMSIINIVQLNAGSNLGLSN